MNFNEAIERVLSHEGGYVNNPADPGGETQWGISKRSYPNVDIKALTRSQAVEIYRRDFWGAVNADDMPDGVAYQTLDFAVNSGVGTAIRYMQRALGVASLLVQPVRQHCAAAIELLPDTARALDRHREAVAEAAYAGQSAEIVIKRAVFLREDHHVLHVFQGPLDAVGGNRQRGADGGRQAGVQTAGNRGTQEATAMGVGCHCRS